MSAVGLHGALRFPRAIGSMLEEEVLPEIGEDESVNYKLAPLRAHLDRTGVREVCVNRPGEICVETHEGWISERCPTLTFRHLQELATSVATFTGQHTAEGHPLLSAALPTGERIQIVQPSATAAGVIALCLRKPGQTIMTLEEHDKSGLFDQITENNGALSKVDSELLNLKRERRFVEFMRLAVRARKTILLAGATGSGKTSFIKTLCEEIPADERLITIEDAPEVTLPQRANKVHLFYSKGGQSTSNVTAESLLEACLRLRPDRIIQAEIRGKEAFAFLNIAASGHPGSMSTLHAGSCEEAFARLAFMVRNSEGGAGMTLGEVNVIARNVVDVVAHFVRVDRKFRITGVHFDPAAEHGYA